MNTTPTTARTPGQLRISDHGESLMLLAGEKYVATVTIHQIPRRMGLCEEDERIANAHRLADCWNACDGINPAAVPELLEALKNAGIALTFYREWMSREKPGTDYPYGIDCENKARAAIAKATGGEVAK